MSAALKNWKKTIKKYKLESILDPVNSKSPVKFRVPGCGCENSLSRVDLFYRTISRNKGKYVCPCQAKTGAEANFDNRAFRKAIRANGDAYISGFDDFKTRRDSKITVRHRECGAERDVTMDSIYSGRGCPHCNGIVSHASRHLEKKLKDRKIKFIKEFSEIISPITGKKLPTDFFLPDFNLHIEIDGSQHYTVCNRFGGLKSLRGIMLRDFIKDREISLRGERLKRIQLKDKASPKSQRDMVDALLKNTLEV